jgi:hypothetical protein
VQGFNRGLGDVSEQWARVEDNAIVRIEHRDLEGERERLDAFKKRAGVGDPA